MDLPCDFTGKLAKPRMEKPRMDFLISVFKHRHMQFILDKLILTMALNFLSASTYCYPG